MPLCKLPKKVKWYLQEVIRLKKSPHSIAMGFALGTFVGILPTPGLNLILGILITLIYKRVNKFSLFGAMLIWNPLFTVLLYPLSYKLGEVIFRSSPLIEFKWVLFTQVYHISRRFLVGNFIVALIASISGYFIVRVIIMFVLISRRKNKFNLDEKDRINS